MKKEIGTLDATPSKRIFLSIIADYDLNRSVCELADNALDVWVRHEKAKPLAIGITLDKTQQTITVEDNAGGLPKSDLRYVVGPGETGTDPAHETIGIFGVGTKRAVVALAQDIKITTRFPKEKTHQISFDDHWLEDPSWEMPVYEVDSVAEGTTIVELQKLRQQVTDEGIAHLRDHLSTTYASFLKRGGVTITVNGDAILPQFFENWAYPPKYGPRKYSGSLTSVDRSVSVEVVAGLTSESSPAAGEYGVYFYCNGRLIARGLKTFEVGFTKGLAGLPHPKVSLTRVLVFLKGDARDMPWNSSKSDISTKHPVFLALHDWLVQVVKDYATLSRTWMGEWPDKVFKYTGGSITEVEVESFPEAARSFLPPLPKSRPRYGEIITQKNKQVAKKKPWAKGLYEGVIAADLIAKQRLEQRDRIALIVLDSTLEIAFKEFLAYESGVTYSDKKLLEIFTNRYDVHNEIKKYSKAKIKPDTWKKIDHYYRLRNKLIHERVTAGITEGEIADFRGVVERVLKRLFGLRFDRE